MSEKPVESARTSKTHEEGDFPAIPTEDNFNDDSKVPFLTLRTFMMTILVSVGGLCFGYDTGQISGFLEMVSKSTP